MNLSQKHLEEFAQSGISQEIALMAGLQSVTASEASKVLGYAIPTGGWAIPYSPLKEDGEIIWQVKPDNPLKDKKGRERKYLLPIGKPPRLYLPPNLDIHQTDYVIITEGVKKVLSAIQSGFPCIGLQGVWNFLEDGLPLQDLEVLRNKIVYLCFDSDVMSKREVREALRVLNKILEKQDTRTLICTLPQSGDHKTGLDDFIVAGGDVSILLQEALSLPDWEMERMQEIQEQRIEEFLHEYEHPLPKITTGLPALDSILGGWKRGEVVAIAGRPGHSKTTFVIQNAVRAAERHHRVALFSLEMDFSDVISWSIANQQSISRDSILRNILSVSELRESIQHLREKTKNLLIYAGSDCPRTPKEIARLGVALKPDLLIIDHHRMIHYGKARELRHEIHELMQYLKHDIAQDCKASVLLVCQMNRAVERDFQIGRRQELPFEECWNPLMTHVDEGPAIEQNSQAVIFWCRPFILTRELNDYNKFIMDLAKSRFGITGRYNFTIDPEKGIII